MGYINLPPLDELKLSAAELEAEYDRLAQAAYPRPARIDLKVTTADGDYWHTGFNGTIEEARAYYLGQRFEGWDDAKGREFIRAPVVSVEVVE